MSHVLRLKKSNCQNCYKCIRHCPVKSIRFSGGQAHIIEDECILCGTCFVVCPQNAKEIVDDTELVKVMLQQDAPVYLSMAPSFVANYHVGIESINDAAVKLGFAGAEETAIGATIVKREYDKMVNAGDESCMISSCCHSVNLLIQKHYPDLLNRLVDIASPMQAHAIDIKRRHPDAKVVFVGPCVAKKDEALQYADIVDATLTFENLSNWFNEEGIVLEDKKDSRNQSKARIFPTSGGILKTMEKSNPNFKYMVVDGVENCMAALEDIRHGGKGNVFIEMSACSGSCMNGPVMEKYNSHPVIEYMEIAGYAGMEDFPVEQPELNQIRKNFDVIDLNQMKPPEREIQATLRKMGKYKPSDQLNCGTCGYESCREKAIAVLQGKAEIGMCLPYMREKAEDFSNIIFDNTPNGLIVVNERLEIQQLNPAACEILNVRRATDVMGEQIVTLLEPKPFMDALETRKPVFMCVYLAEYDRYVEQTVLYDKKYGMVFCLMRDVSDEARERARKEEIRLQTTDIADKVVDTQMRIVQEIASLLGETAAETKIALTKLKESISDE